MQGGIPFSIAVQTNNCGVTVTCVDATARLRDLECCDAALSFERSRVPQTCTYDNFTAPRHATCAMRRGLALQ